MWLAEVGARSDRLALARAARGGCGGRGRRVVGGEARFIDQHVTLPSPSLPGPSRPRPAAARSRCAPLSVLGQWKAPARRTTDSDAPSSNNPPTTERLTRGRDVTVTSLAGDAAM